MTPQVIFEETYRNRHRTIPTDNLKVVDAALEVRVTGAAQGEVGMLEPQTPLSVQRSVEGPEGSPSAETRTRRSGILSS